MGKKVVMGSWLGMWDLYCLLWVVEAVTYHYANQPCHDADDDTDNDIPRRWPAGLGVWLGWRDCRSRVFLCARGSLYREEQQLHRTSSCIPLSASCHLSSPPDSLNSPIISYLLWVSSVAVFSSSPGFSLLDEGSTTSSPCTCSDGKMNGIPNVKGREKDWVQSSAENQMHNTNFSSSCTVQSNVFPL